MEDVGVKKFGERVLREVEVWGLDEVLHSLWELSMPSSQRSVFGIPELDALLPPPRPTPRQRESVQPGQSRPQPDNEDWILDPPVPHIPKEDGLKPYTPTVVELVSPPPTHHPSPAGKTSLLYLITTLAILPSEILSTPLNGKSSAVIIIDPLSHFHIPRLTQILITHITTRLQASGTPTNTATTKREITSCITKSLAHIHIFQPTTWPALLETLSSLQTYLFNPSRHKSSHRPISSLILKDLHIFVPYLRNLPPRQPPPHSSSSPNPLTHPSTTLTKSLTHISTLLHCPILLSTHAPSPTGFKPALPAPNSWPQDVRVTRLGLRRVHVGGFARGTSVEEAEAERGKRWDVVRRGKFECWKVGAREEGRGFVFRVERGGVVIERAEGGV